MSAVRSEDFLAPARKAGAGVNKRAKSGGRRVPSLVYKTACHVGSNNMYTKLNGWILALLAIFTTFASRADITISGAPDASALTASLTTAYGLAVALGLTVLGIGLVVALIRRGVKAK